MVCSWHLQVGLVVVGGHCRWKMHNSILSTWFFERSGCFNWIELQQVGIHSICNASLHCSLIGPSFVQTKGPYRIFHFRLGSMGMNPVHLHAPFSGLTCWMILWWVFPKWREISWWEMKHLMQFYINGVPEKASWLVVDSGFWSHLNRFLNSQGWFPTSFKIQDHPKKGSFLGGVFAHFFCFETRCRCAYCSGEQQFWNQFLEASRTWYGWYGCWDFQALVKIGAIPDTKSCFGKESPALWQETKLFFEDIYADEFNLRTWRLSKMVIAPGFVHLIILRYS